MKKVTAIILSMLSLATLSTTAAGGSMPKTTAKADTLSSGVAFTSPLDVATASGYTAVAEHNLLHLYNHTNGGVWQEYSHTYAVTKIQFHNDELYFLDEQSQLYRLHANNLDDTKKAEKTEIVCSTFTLHENTLYYANVSAGQTAIRQVPLQDLTAQAEPFTVKAYFPTLSYYNQALYALDGSNSLYRLALETKQSVKVATLPMGTDTMTLSGGQVLGAADGGFFSYDLAELSEKQDYSLCTPLVNEAGDYHAVSVSEAGAYLLSGNVAKVYDLVNKAWKTETEFSKPGVKAIPTSTLLSSVNAPTTTPLQLVQTKPEALLVEVDFSTAQENSVFPYKGTVRTQSLTAIALGEREGYALIAHRDSASGAYKTYVLPTTGFSTADAGLLLPYATPKTGYLSNAVGLYKYPALLTKLLSLERGASVSLIGEVMLDSETYYQVQQGEQVGYIPKSYVSLYNAATPSTQTQVIGDNSDNADGIWRLVYILLGTAAIGILADFLILRKKPKDEE